MIKNTKLIVIATVVVVLAAVAAWQIKGISNQGNGTVSSVGNNSNSNGTSTPSESASQGAEVSSPGTGSPSPAASFVILSPKLGDQWVLEQPHAIVWNKPAGVTGEVYLVDAFSNTIVGWINSGTGEKSTSTMWGAKYLALTRNGGLQKIVGRGTYFVKVRFDRNQGSIRSSAFSLIAPDEVTHNTYQVSLNNLALSPATITAKNGDTIVFVNDDDAITYQIVSPAIFGPFKLAPGQSAVLVLNLKSGTYPYSDLLHAGIAGKIVVSP